MQCLDMMRDQLRDEVTPRRGSANRHKGKGKMWSVSWHNTNLKIQVNLIIQIIKQLEVLGALRAPTFS